MKDGYVTPSCMEGGSRGLESFKQTLRPGGLGEWEEGQARKGTRRMPWHQEAMKDVAGCEKCR